MRIFPILDDAMLEQEKRTAYASRTPRVWPSEASAVLFDQRESKVVGRCHRQSYWRLIGEPSTNNIDVVGARRFRTGRAMELDVVGLAKDAGIFVAAGVRYHVADIDLPLELDLVVIDPETKQLVIVENKTIYGYMANKKVIKDGHPKLEGVMQSTIYLNEFGNGAKLKRVIQASWDDKASLAAQLREMEAKPDFNELSAQYQAVLTKFGRNRVEVDFSRLSQAHDGPVSVKLTYETRDDCQTREFDISLSQDPIDRVHYPEIDGIPQKLFTVESIYERYALLQSYYISNVNLVRKALALDGVKAPLAADMSPSALYAAETAYWNTVFDRVRKLPPKYWPPADYQWKYPDDKIQMLGEAGFIGKTKYRDWQKRVKGKTHVGAWQCAYCPHKAKCIAVEYPQYTYLVADLLAVESEEEAA